MPRWRAISSAFADVQPTPNNTRANGTSAPNAIAPGAVEGDRIERVFAGRAQIGGRSVEEVRAAAMAARSIKTMIDPKDIAALAVFLASDAAKSISGQVLPIDNDRQRA
jgi:NAD(P)-dependent dehydrogenase (short-subunit alcohol dehydrogenase family)